MSDPYDSDEDFVLPPLPSKPQKSIIAFFGGKDSKAKSKSQNQANQTKNDNKAKSKESEDLKTKPLEEKNIGHECQDFPKSSESKSCMEPIVNFNKMELVRAPFPKVNHTIQGTVQVENLGKSSKMVKYLSAEDMNLEANIQWSPLLPLEEKKEVLKRDGIVSKPIEKCLEELETSYPDIPVRKLFQQYLLSQKKIVMSDLKKVQASKFAVESMWNKQSKIEEADRLAKMEKVKAEEMRIKAEEMRIQAEEELARRNEGKDIRKMFSKKSKRRVVKKNEEQEKAESSNKDGGTTAKGSNTEAKASKGKKKKKELGKDEEPKALTVSVAGLFGKKKDRPKRKCRRNEEDEGDGEEEKKDENCDRLATKKDGEIENSTDKKKDRPKRKPRRIEEDENDDDEETKGEKSDQPSSQRDRGIENFLGKKKDRSKRKPKRIDDNDDGEDEEDKVAEGDQSSSPKANENSATGEQGARTATMSSKVDDQEQVVDPERGVLGDSVEIKAEGTSQKVLLCNDVESVEPEKKRKTKNKRGLDFLKIKFIETGHNKEKEEREIEEKVHSKDIRSMFAKTNKVKDISVKVEKVEVSAQKNEKPPESLKHDATMDIDVAGERRGTAPPAPPLAVMVKPEPAQEVEKSNGSNEPKTNDTAMEIDIVGDSQSTTTPSADTIKPTLTDVDGVQDQPTVKKEVVSKVKANLFSYFSKTRKSEDSKNLKNKDLHSVKEETGNDTNSLKSNKTNEIGQVENNTEDKIVSTDSSKETDTNNVNNVDIQPKKYQEDQPLNVHEKSQNEALATSNVPPSTEQDQQKDLVTPNVTPCKIQLNKIASPTPCSVEVEDFLTVVSDNSIEKTCNRKRKRSNSQSLLTSNKVQKQNDLSNARRGLRKCGRPQDVTNLGEALTIGKEDEIKNDSYKEEPEPESKPSLQKIAVVKSEATDIELEDEKENSQQSKSIRRSSRSRKTVNYNESVLLSEAVSNCVSEKKPSKKQKRDNTTKMELDESVCIVSDLKKEEPESDEKTVDEMVKIPARELCFPESPKRTRPVIDLVLDEITMNSFLSWTDKYQPIKARHVIGDKNKTKELFTWLCSWKEKHESIIKKMAARAMKASRRRGNVDSDSDFDSGESDEEELLSNTLVLTGPTGCGTTAAVLACAKQMDFKVLELNPSIYRTGKHMFDLVSEAVVSHRVHKNISKIQPLLKGGVDSFFTSTGTKVERKEKKEKVPVAEQDIMSLVLVEQADIVYEEQDKGFWQGLHDLRRLAKRPMILTANDNRIWPLIHTDENQHTEMIQLDYPDVQHILPMMQIMCLVERVFVPTPLLLSIIEFCRNDVRQTILQLQFWFEQGQAPLFKSWRKENNGDVCVVDDADEITKEKSDFTKEKSNLTKENSVVAKEMSVVPKEKSVVAKENSDITMEKFDAIKKTSYVTEENSDVQNVDVTCGDNVDVAMKNSAVTKTSDTTGSVNDADISIETSDTTSDLTENTGVNGSETFSITKNNDLACFNNDGVIMKNSDVTYGISNDVITNGNYSEEKCEEGNENFKEKLEAVVVPFQRLPLFEEEEKILDKEKIKFSELKCTRRCYTFVKPKRNMDVLSDISDVIENLSEVDAFLHASKHVNAHKDNFIRSTMVDSLSDELWKEKGNGHIYPNKNLCLCVHISMDHCYSCISERNCNDDYMTNKRAWSFRDLYSDISSHLPLSSRLNPENIPLHVKPYLSNICWSEETRKISQRRQRRFLHYLDTNRIFLDESIIGLLKENSFLSPDA